MKMNTIIRKMRSLYKNQIYPASMAGFTMVELIVVLVIIGILSSQVIISINSASHKVKNSLSSLRTDINLARAEAVTRATDVYVSFLFDSDIDGDGDIDDGYRVWIDDALPAGYTAADTLIKLNQFTDDVQFYDTDLSGVGGPDVKPGGGALADPDDGVSFVGNQFKMRNDGTANIQGTVYIYVSDDDGGMECVPYSLVVSSTGRIRAWYWQKSTSSWSRK
jgi:prepilin-type N-terminal cleavage/methylation domain-containing protein